LRFTRADDTVVLTITRPAATSYRAVIDLSGVQGDTSRDVNPNQAAAGGTAGGTAAGAAGGSRGSTGTGATGNTSSTGVVGGPESTAELPGQETSGTGAGSGTGRSTNTGDGSGAAANPSGGTGAPSGAAGTTASAGAAAGTTGAAGTARGTTGTAAGAGTTGTGGTAGGRNDQATTGAAQGSAQTSTGNTGTGTTVRVGPGTTPATGTASTANNRADQNYDKVVTATPGKLTLNVLPVGSPVATQASDATFTLVPPRGATRATVNIDGARVFLGYFSDQPLDEQFKYFDDQFTRQGFKRVTGSGANVEATANAKITYRRGNGDVAFELQQFGGENAYRVIADFGNLVDSLK
jgi:hypothetical protein